jgi:hypothetical protein
VSTDPEKTKAVSEWPVPKNVTEARSYLGLCYYYRKFIYHFANITVGELQSPKANTVNCQSPLPEKVKDVLDRSSGATET